jgi:ABC-type spermidine/putrescine transport system permease subunit I
VATATFLCLWWDTRSRTSSQARRTWRAVPGLFLAPFWISYMLRMTAWIGLLEDEGLVNRALQALGLTDAPIGFLNGRPSTLIFGLVYGYVPFMILPLFAVLDRIPPPAWRPPGTSERARGPPSSE